jgi:hypothetical protein
LWWVLTEAWEEWLNGMEIDSSSWRKGDPDGANQKMKITMRTIQSDPQNAETESVGEWKLKVEVGERALQTVQIRG